MDSVCLLALHPSLHPRLTRPSICDLRASLSHWSGPLLVVALAPQTPPLPPPPTSLLPPLTET